MLLHLIVHPEFVTFKSSKGSSILNLPHFLFFFRPAAHENIPFERLQSKITALPDGDTAAALPSN